MTARRPVVAAIVLLAASVVGCSGRSGGRLPENSQFGPDAVRTPAKVQAAQVSDVFGDPGPLFGVSVPRADTAALDGIETTTGCRPGLVEVFVAVPNGMPDGVLAHIPGVPVLSVEPWFPNRGVTQSDSDQDTYIAGKWDAQLEDLAAQVRAFGHPVLIRFAHEMNGHWYPWAATGDNTPSKYIAAWRHVVSLFRSAGAVNALWVWSPNIRRGTGGSPFATYYPGDEWVDIVGLTGYGVHDDDPGATYDSAVSELDELTDKPILLTETGAQPDSSKTQWISGFGRWLAATPKVVGFVWFEKKAGADAHADWRYDDNPVDLAAFRNSLTAGHVRCEI